MEGSCGVVVYFEGDSLSYRVTIKSTLEDLKNHVCNHWTVLNPWSIRFIFLHGECGDCSNTMYVDSDFMLQTLFSGFYIKGIENFSLLCERFISTPTQPSSSSFIDSVYPSPAPNKATNDVTKSSRVVSPVSKDARAKLVFEGSQAVVKQRKSQLWATAITGVGQLFYNGVQEVRNAVRQVCFENGHEPDNKKRKSEPSRYTVRCKNWKSSGCLWEFHAKSITTDNSIFEVMRYVKEHNCGAGYKEANVCIPAKFVKQVINDQVRNNPKISPRKIIHDFKVDYELILPYQQAYHGIKLIHKDMYGDDVKAYTDLVWYVEKVKDTNEGSIIDFQINEQTQEFKRLFIAYGAVVKGFEYCRAMLYLDATFLTGRFKGCLMAATAKNGNEEFYPVAYGICSHEDGQNWLWFLENLKKVVKGREIVFISDQGTGLLSAVPKVFPNSPHSYCYYHMKKNLPINGDDQLYPHVLGYWRHAVYALTEGGYNKAVKDLRDLGCGHVVNWMERHGREHWSNAYFKGCRYGVVASTVAESFNSWIKDEKKMPISAIVNTIRMKMMKMIYTRHKVSESFTGRLTPEYEKKLKVLTAEGNAYTVVPAGDFLFEVVADHRYEVNLETWYCSCNRWKVYGFPCSHAIQSILASGQKVYDFVEVYFTSGWYKTLYSCFIHPVPDSEKEYEKKEGERVIPPPHKNNPGRPKTERFKDNYVKNQKQKIICGNCKQLSNHNRRTCQHPAVHDFSQI